MTYYTAPARPALPTSLKAARVLCFVWFGLGALYIVAAAAKVVMYAEYLTDALVAQMLGALTWALLPAVLALVGGLLTRGGRRASYVLVLVAGVLGVIGALSTIGAGSPTGVFSLLLPGALLVLVHRPAARAYRAVMSA